MRKLIIILILAGWLPAGGVIPIGPFREISSPIGLYSYQKSRKQKAIAAKRKIEREKKNDENNNQNRKDTRNITQ